MVIILDRNVTAMYFSGTGTTEKMVSFIAKNIAEKLGVKYDCYNFTKPQARISAKTFTPDDIVILGTPVIAGRVPNLLLEYLNSLVGNGALGVSIVMFGNRSYDDALVELKAIMQKCQFKTIAAGGFAAEHSFSTLLGQDRPDSTDLNEAKLFADKIAFKILNGDYSIVTTCENEEIGPYYMPRDRHGNHIDIRKVKPKTDLNKCTECGFCAENCPLGSIDFNDVSKIPGICMKCCRCVKLCPSKAKFFDDPGYIYHKEELEAVYGQRRAENKYFI